MDKHRLSLIVIGLLAVVILFGGWLLGVQPQIDRIDSANAQTKTVGQLNGVQQARNDALAADNENLGQYKADLAAKQTEIPAKRGQQELINQIDAAAIASGVTVRTLRFDAALEYVAPVGVDVGTASSGTLIEVPVALTAVGPRPSLEAFVALLQRSSRIVTISSSQYTGGDDASIDLTGTTWVLLQPPQ